MSADELRWAIGIAVTVVLGVAGIAIAAFRAVSARIDEMGKEMATAIKDGDNTLHERIGRVRDDLNDNYVRRVDMDSHMKRVDDTLKEVRDDQKQIIRSLAALEARQRRAPS